MRLPNPYNGVTPQGQNVLMQNIYRMVICDMSCPSYRPDIQDRFSDMRGYFLYMDTSEIRAWFAWQGIFVFKCDYSLTNDKPLFTR